jgi:cytoskeleton protein RodZ
MTETQATEGLDTEAVEGVSADDVPAEVTEVVAPPESETPGAVLRRAREARGQSIPDVVQVIRFSARQIEALERDDYASLPGSTAVRGLVRNYAKFLKLDATPLLVQLEPAVPVPEADVRPPTNMGEAEQPTLVERVPPRFILAGGAVLLLALGGFWLATLPADGGLSSFLRGMSGGPAAVKSGSVAVPVVAPVVQPAPAVVAESAPVAENAASAPPPFAGLRVEFDDHSWIEIRDATQKVVFVGEYPAGTRQNVEGKAPFQVWVGRASGVRMFMGERSIDLKPHTREEVARFTVE